MKMATAKYDWYKSNAGIYDNIEGSTLVQEGRNWMTECSTNLKQKLNKLMVHNKFV